VPTRSLRVQRGRGLRRRTRACTTGRSGPASIDRQRWAHTVAVRRNARAARKPRPGNAPADGPRRSASFPQGPSRFRKDRADAGRGEIDETSTPGEISRRSRRHRLQERLGLDVCGARRARAQRHGCSTSPKASLEGFRHTNGWVSPTAAAACGRRSSPV